MCSYRANLFKNHDYKSQPVPGPFLCLRKALGTKLEVACGIIRIWLLLHWYGVIVAAVATVVAVAIVVVVVIVAVVLNIFIVVTLVTVVAEVVAVIICFFCCRFYFYCFRCSCCWYFCCHCLRKLNGWIKTTWILARFIATVGCCTHTYWRNRCSPWL